MKRCKFTTFILFICILPFFISSVYAEPVEYAKKVFACYEGASGYPYITISGDVGIVADTSSAVPVKFKDGNVAYKVACKKVNLTTGETIDRMDCMFYQVIDKIHVVYDLEDMEGSVKVYSLGQDDFDTVYDAFTLIAKRFYIEDICFNDDLNYPYTDLGDRFDKILDISSSIPLDTDRGRGYAVSEYSIIYGTGKRINNGRVIMFVNNDHLLFANARNGTFVRERVYTVDRGDFNRYYYAYRLAKAKCIGK